MLEQAVRETQNGCDQAGLYACPDCGGSLDSRERNLRCQGCQAEWRVNINNIPSFTRHALSWTPMEQETLRRIVEAAEKGQDWKDAVSEHGREISGYTKRYILEEDRADWLFLLPVRRSWRVLDVGSGWGSVSIPVSRWVGEIFCADATEINCRFLKARAEQEGIDNLHVFNANPLDFPAYPFPNGSFDLIVLNGVLEWTGNADRDTPVYDLQVNALAALKKLLAPGGCLYIGIENRFAYGALLGRAMHHELPFTGLMPRPLANAWMKLFKRRPHRTYIHGMKGYRKLLAKAGLGNVEFYLPRTSYRDPYWLIPGDTDQGVKIWASRLAKPRTVTRRLIRWWAERLPIRGIWPCYSMVCRKEG